MAYVYLPLMVLPLYASIEKLDFRLLEAGYDLYASRLQVLRHIVLPLVKPGIIAGSHPRLHPRRIGAYVTPRVLGGGKNMMLGNLIELQFGAGPQLAARLGACRSRCWSSSWWRCSFYVRNASQPEGRAMA